MSQAAPRTYSLLSIVAPVYDEEALVEEFVSRTRYRLLPLVW